ncbi:MAG TPA: prepilin-type N-terminal cleavage/methylation domain-containing protein [Gemmatimonadaceae bacterium]|jgi:prepilin-type N-terminal cleavage/methylation domain-containing protein|nr:prepilin-type N-terminal cleavage/methylation domain-containing protein [Gemmatimonadaceae bacterium]
MRRSSARLGFTFIELLVVMAVLGILAAVGVPRIRNMKERAYQATLRSDLGAMRTAQEAFFAENKEYATEVTLLDFRPSTNVTVSIVSEDPTRGWKAAAKHKWLDLPCITAAGEEAVGVESGAIVCPNLLTAASAATSK